MDEGTTRRGTDTRVHRPEKPAGPTDISTSGLNVVWSLLKQKQMKNKKQLSTIFVHRNVEPDPKNPYMVRGILRSRSFYLQ